MGPHARYGLPPVLNKDDGSPRLVGFELEFSGITLDETAAALRSSLGAELRSESAAERVLLAGSLGEFTVELDWAYLKRKAAQQEQGEAGGDEWIEHLSQAAALLVPVEVVCPPLPVTGLGALEPMVAALREAGAVGTEESLLAAYGVHINPEIPVLDAATLLSYLQAFALLQWWLVDAHAVDATRKVSPYIDLFPEAYLKRLLSSSDTGMDGIFSDYLAHNATRNRALDLLPLLAEIDAQRVRKAVDDPRIKARPTFHYRLPNCHIEQPDWSLSGPWNTWLVVERVAHRVEDLAGLGAAFLDAWRPILGVNRGEWVGFIDQWLKDRGLA
ncbi:MAG: amidoligase family protein [Gammaproteobacteria bacterium]